VRRIVELQRVQAEVQAELFAAMAGKTVEVLVDGISKRRASEVQGRTSGHTPVNIPGGPELIGELVRVTITSHGPNSLRGELADRAIPARQEAAHAD
jgi:tRNA-2-methylthio-N6-dimethylallyladenosine synthase